MPDHFFHILEGFLGIYFQLCRVHRKNGKEQKYCTLWPSDRLMKRIKERVKTVIGRCYSLPLEEMIEELNPVLRGWDNYQRKAKSARKRVLKLNGFVRDRLRIFLKRKYIDQSRGTRRVHNGLAVRLGLYQFG